jgi:NADP-dependent 3-hydroxy acid dehydrogenase YdfG
MNDRVMVVTGASSGIGAATAEHLAAQGATVVLIARRREALHDVAARCGGRARVVVADVSVRDEVRRAVAETLAQTSRIDVWINNAGRGISRPPSELSDADVDDMMQINVKSVLYGMQEVLPHFKQQGHGHVINISSMLGRLPLAPGRSAYTGAKHFVNALTAMIRAEVQETHPGIQFSLVSPGIVWTEFGKNAVHGGPDSRDFPVGQEATEVAAVVASVVRSRKPDVYTRPGAAAQVAAYYATLGADPEEG